MRYTGIEGKGVAVENNRCTQKNPSYTTQMHTILSPTQPLIQEHTPQTIVKYTSRFHEKRCMILVLLGTVYRPKVEKISCESICERESE